jgi:hypothetical protein
MSKLWELITGPLFQIIDKLIPDPQKKAEMQLKMLELQQSSEFKELEAELKIAEGQIDINRIEAASQSLFKSGWRPLIGWICGVGLAYNYLLQPLLAWLSLNHGWQSPPSPDLGDLFILLGGVLGLGAMRTTERIQGKA